MWCGCHGNAAVGFILQCCGATRPSVAPPATVRAPPAATCFGQISAIYKFYRQTFMKSSQNRISRKCVQSVGSWCILTDITNLNVYWTVHRLDSWMKIDQLMSLALLFHYLLLNMFRMLVHPSSGACDLLWIYFMCFIALVRCVLVLRCGSAGVEWCPYAGWSSASACIRIPHHPSRTTP